MCILKFKLMKTTKKTLVYLAAIVWYIGGITLFRSGLELTLQTRELKSGGLWPWIFITLGIGLGVFQALQFLTAAAGKTCRGSMNWRIPACGSSSARDFSWLWR